MSLNQVQCCFTSRETIIRDGEPRTATSTFTRLLSSEVYMHLSIKSNVFSFIYETEPVSLNQVQCCFTSTETTIRTVKDGELRAATSTFTQLLTSKVYTLKALI